MRDCYHHSLFTVEGSTRKHTDTVAYKNLTIIPCDVYLFTVRGNLILELSSHPS